MIKRSLKDDFRRVDAPIGALDADRLVRLVAGELEGDEREAVIASAAGSALEADLLRLLKALEPASTELAAGLVERAPAAHPLPIRRRAAHGGERSRRGEWIRRTALAASLTVAVAAGLMHSASMRESPATQAGGDKIFASASEGRASAAGPAAAKGDVIFSTSDRIFRDHLNDS